MHAVIDPATSSEYVLMTREEAVALSGTLATLRKHLNGYIAWTQSQRMLDPFISDRAVADLRGQLATLTAFHKAHAEAHGLPIDGTVK